MAINKLGILVFLASFAIGMMAALAAFLAPTAAAGPGESPAPAATIDEAAGMQPAGAIVAEWDAEYCGWPGCPEGAIRVWRRGFIREGEPMNCPADFGETETYLYNGRERVVPVELSIIEGSCHIILKIPSNDQGSNQ